MNEYKEILLAAVGSTPQIITETLYYYTHPFYQNQRKFNEIRILVTKNRLESTYDLLFKNNIIDKMCKDLEINRDEIKLTNSDIIVMKDDDGSDLEDIRGSNDNLSAINTIYN